jgi:hypothetical protein
MPNGASSPSVQLRLRVLQDTYDTMVVVAAKHGISNGPAMRGKRRGRVNLGPLLDMIAGKLEQFAQLFPADERNRFDRKWRLTADQVRLIRLSTDKIICIASEHRADPATVSRIRTGKAYRWVK